MARQSTIRDLRDALRDVEIRKRQIEEEYQALAATLRYFESLTEGQSRPQYPSTQSGGVPSRGSSSELRDAIYEILTAEGPLHRMEIYDRLVERGIRVPGREPINNVGAHLSIDPRFKNVDRGEWGLSDLPNSEGDLQQEDGDIETTLRNEVNEEYENTHDQDNLNAEENLPW